MNKKVIVIGMVLMLIPAMITAMAAAQEEEFREETPVIQIGSWKTARLTNLVFEPMIAQYDTNNKTIDLYIEDQAGGIRGIIPGIMMQKGVFVVYENETDNRTALVPDAYGIYTLDMPKTGNYTVVIMTAPSMNIPLVGDFLFPGSMGSVVICREYEFPYIFMISCAIVICASAGGGYAWKKMKDKKRNLP